MDKNLGQLYIYFIIAFIIFINIFSDIFININNSIDYLANKTMIVFGENKDNKVNIYDNKANVIIMLDDAWKTQYTIGFNYMNKRNIRGSIAVIPELIGAPDYMNKSDLSNLYNQNWDLLNHTYSHINLSNKKIDKQFSEINKANKWLLNRGFINPNKVLIYPEGKYDQNTIKIIKKLSYISGRSTKEGFNDKIPTNLYEIKVKNVLTNINPNTVNGWIDYAIENNLTIILLFHKLENKVDKTLMKYKEKDFYKIIDYIDKKRDNINIIIYTEWMQTITNN